METPPRRLPALRLSVTAGLGLACGWIGWLCWVHRGHFVDDSFISLRVAANWLAGRGLVFNPGELVEGMTNLGWVLVVAVAGWLAPLGLPLVAKVVGTGCLVVAVALAVASYRRLVPKAHPVELLLLPVLLALSPELVYFSIAGMETGLAALLSLAAIWMVLRERPRPVTAALLAAALATVRPEAVLIFPLFAALALASRGGLPHRRLLVALGAFVAAIAAVTLVRYAYYGALLPNTALAKPPGSAADVLYRLRGLFTGTNPDVPPPYGTGVFLLAGAWGAILAWRRRPAAGAFLAATALAGLAFGVYAPTDWTGLGRYFAPYVPAAAILLVLGLARGIEALVRSRRATAIAVAAILALFAGYDLWRGHEHLGERALADYPGFVLASDTLISPARWVDEHLPADAVIATRRIGALGYFGHRRVFDYAFGLTDRRVARRVAARGKGFDSPDDPELAGLWRQVRPGWVLEDAQRLDPLRTPGGEISITGLSYRTVRTFPLGDGGTRWELAARPTAWNAGPP